MRATLSMFLALGLVFAGSPDQARAGGPGGSDTLTGQVIDLSCLVVHDLQGDGHRECAQVCADQGVPLAILGDDGDIYHPVSMEMPSSGDELNAMLRPHAERNVTVQGELVERGGSKGIIIESIQAQ